jgi:hypothetical protein
MEPRAAKLSITRPYRVCSWGTKGPAARMEWDFDSIFFIWHLFADSPLPMIAERGPSRMPVIYDTNNILEVVAGGVQMIITRIH